MAREQPAAATQVPAAGLCAGFAMTAATRVPAIGLSTGLEVTASGTGNAILRPKGHLMTTQLPTAATRVLVGLSAGLVVAATSNVALRTKET